MMMSEFITQAVKQTEAGDIRLFYLGNLAYSITLEDTMLENNIRDSLMTLAMRKQGPNGERWQYIKQILRQVWQQVREVEKNYPLDCIDIYNEASYSITYDESNKEFYVDKQDGILLYFPKRNGFCYHCLKNVFDSYCEECKREIVFSNEEQYKDNLTKHIFKNVKVISIDNNNNKSILVTTDNAIDDDTCKMLAGLSITYKGIDTMSGNRKYEIIKECV